MNMVSAVFDCNVFVQSLLNPKGLAAQCMELARDRRVTLFISRETIDEFRDVIFRPNIFSKLPDLNTSQIEAFINEILNISNLVRPVAKSFRLERDPKDEKYIDLAVATSSNYLISWDNDLLDLMTAHSDEAKEFRQKFRHLKVVEPIEFLRIIREMDLALKP